MRDDLYMITCSARTGSSLLETSLLSHPDILSHGEVYPPTHVGALRGKYTSLATDDDERTRLTEYRDSNQTAFLYKYVYDAQGHRTVGHKLKHEELLLPKFAETREAVRRDPDIKIIHLRRQNLFERFVSAWLVNRVTGVTEIHSDEERPPVERVTIPAEACRDDFDKTSAQYNFFQKFFSEHQIYELTYEQLVGPERERVLTEVQAFLGVEPKALSSRLKKVSPPSMRSFVDNYDELREHFADSPYAAFFKE